MKCSQVKKKLSAFLDGQVTGSDQTGIRRHLESCSDCRQHAGELQRISDEFALIEDVNVRPYFLTRVRQRIADRQAKPLAGRRVPAWIRRVALPAGATACIVLTALLGSSLGRTVYSWRAGRASAASCAGSVLLDQAPEGPLGRVYDQLFAGGKDG